jgi:hypothetical protein
LRPLGPNTALKLHLAQRPALTTPLLRLIQFTKYFSPKKI